MSRREREVARRVFLRLKNVLDYDVVKPSIDSIIKDESVSYRIKEVLSVLDESYGVSRLSKDMGGYVYLFTNEDTYNDNIDRLLELNNIKTDMYEYSDDIGSIDDALWKEELYLIGSEDSITVFHPVSGGV